jgi:hypothetical protein
VFATKKSGVWVEYEFATLTDVNTLAVANDGDHFVIISGGGGASIRIWQSTDEGETWAETGTAPPGFWYLWNVNGVWFSYTGASTYYLSSDLSTWTPATWPAAVTLPYTANQFAIDENDILHVIGDPSSDEAYYSKTSDLSSWSAAVKVLGNIAPSNSYFWSALACRDGHVIVATADNGGTDLVWNVSHDDGDTWAGEDSLTTPADSLDAEQAAVWISGDYAYMSYRGQLAGSGDIFRVWTYRSDDWDGVGAISWSLWRTDVWHEDLSCATDPVNDVGYAIEFYPTVFVDPSTIWQGKLLEFFPTGTQIRVVSPDPRTGNPYVPTFGEQEIDTFYLPPFQLNYDRRSEAKPYTYFF